MPDIIEKEAPSVPEAVFAACRALGIEESQAQIQVLSSPGARRAKVRVAKPGVALPEGASASTPPLPPSDASPPLPSPPRGGEGGQLSAGEGERLHKPADYAPRASVRRPPSPEQAEALRRDVEKLLELMGTPSKTEVKQHAGNTIINIMGEKEGLLIGKRGMTLEALQTLAEEMLHSATGDRSLYAVVDVADYRVRGERKIMDLARGLAEQVLREGVQQSLGPLDPAERRLVHLEIKGMEGVESFSVGDGARKKVVIQKKA